MKKALFDWPIVLRYDVKAKYRLISRKFFGHEVFSAKRLLNQPKPRAFVSVRQTNQIALFSLVCCFCFVRAFSLQSHTKIRKLLYQIIYVVNKFKVHFFPNLSNPKSQGVIPMTDFIISRLHVYEV